MSSTNQKVFLLLIFLFGFGMKSYAQRFYSVVFNQLPKDMQLYARDDSNMAEVPISGFIDVAGWDHMSVVTFRNKKRFNYNKSVLDYAKKTSANFELKPEIKAEMADYDFEVYACKSAADSVLIVTRKDVVAGDFYVIAGQSNAAALTYGNWGSKYCRTVARIPDSDARFLPSDTLWIQSNWSWLYVGVWGIELQKTILEKYGIPTCVINGAIPGSKIGINSIRTENNPADPGTIYGHLLYRTQKSRASRIRGFFWYQGEQDAIEAVENYEAQCDKLFKYWQQDYPMVDQFIVLQINILFNPHLIAGEIRDFQRRAKYLYPKTEHFSTVGLPGYDGVHYSVPGYQALAYRLFDFLEPKNYGAELRNDISSPDIKKVFYSSSRKNEITLVYDEGQKMKWPSDTIITGENGSPVTMSTKNFFFLDGDNTKPAIVKSGTASGNRVVLSMSDSVSAKTLNYLPLSKPENVHIFWGPYITNSRGLGAFSFNNVSIFDALFIPSFTTEPATGISVDVKWEAAVGAATYILERKSEDSANYVKIKEFDDKTLSYNDKNVILDKKYTYRIQAISAGSESPFVESSVTAVLILATEPQNKSDLIKVYPNPVNDHFQVEFKKNTTGILQIFNTNGQSMHSARLKADKSYSVNSRIWPAGTYIISIRNTDGKVISQKAIKQ